MDIYAVLRTDTQFHGVSIIAGAIRSFSSSTLPSRCGPEPAHLGPYLGQHATPALPVVQASQTSWPCPPLPRGVHLPHRSRRVLPLDRHGGPQGADQPSACSAAMLIRAGPPSAPRLPPAGALSSAKGLGLPKGHFGRGAPDLAGGTFADQNVCCCAGLPWSSRPLWSPAAR